MLEVCEEAASRGGGVGKTTLGSDIFAEPPKVGIKGREGQEKGTGNAVGSGEHPLQSPGSKRESGTSWELRVIPYCQSLRGRASTKPSRSVGVGS